MRLMLYFDDGSDFNPGKILIDSVANVICRITFGKHFDSFQPDFEELLQLNNKVFTDTETITQLLVLDFFPISQVLPISCL